MNKEQAAVKATYFSIIGNTFSHHKRFSILAILCLNCGCNRIYNRYFASLLVLFGIKYSNRPADDNHPYGHGRAEPLITFLVVGF
jgi:hypothetical protein